MSGKTLSPHSNHPSICLCLLSHIRDVSSGNSWNFFFLTSSIDYYFVDFRDIDLTPRWHFIFSIRRLSIPTSPLTNVPGRTIWQTIKWHPQCSLDQYPDVILSIVVFPRRVSLHLSFLILLKSSRHSPTFQSRAYVIIIHQLLAPKVQKLITVTGILVTGYFLCQFWIDRIHLDMRVTAGILRDFCHTRKTSKLLSIEMSLNSVQSRSNDRVIISDRFLIAKPYLVIMIKTSLNHVIAVRNRIRLVILGHNVSRYPFVLGVFFTRLSLYQVFLIIESYSRSSSCAIRSWVSEIVSETSIRNPLRQSETHPQHVQNTWFYIWQLRIYLRCTWRLWNNAICRTLTRKMTNLAYVIGEDETWHWIFDITDNELMKWVDSIWRRCARKTTHICHVCGRLRYITRLRNIILKTRKCTLWCFSMIFCHCSRNKSYIVPFYCLVIFVTDQRRYKSQSSSAYER